MPKSEALVRQSVQDTMNAHLELANKYERNGNAEGAARLRVVGNILGAMLVTDDLVVHTILPDAPDEDLKPKDDGFEGWWARRCEAIEFLTQHGRTLKDVGHDCWYAGQSHMRLPNA